MLCNKLPTRTTYLLPHHHSPDSHSFPLSLDLRKWSQLEKKYKHTTYSLNDQREVRILKHYEQNEVFLSCGLSSLQRLFTYIPHFRILLFHQMRKREPDKSNRLEKE